MRWDFRFSRQRVLILLISSWRWQITWHNIPQDSHLHSSLGSDMAVPTLIYTQTLNSSLIRRCITCVFVTTLLRYIVINNHIGCIHLRCTLSSGHKSAFNGSKRKRTYSLRKLKRMKRNIKSCHMDKSVNRVELFWNGCICEVTAWTSSLI
jgi:hypothetical protein